MFYIEMYKKIRICHQNTDLNEPVRIDGMESTVFISREGASTRSDIQHLDEMEIFEATLDFLPKYSKTEWYIYLFCFHKIFGRIFMVD